MTTIDHGTILARLQMTANNSSRLAFSSRLVFAPPMARSLSFHFRGAELAAEMQKVDRSKLYGTVDVETLDDQGRPCTLATLASDGRTLIGKGGTALGVLSFDGRWLERGELKPVDLQGQPIEPVPSSFSAPIELDQTATIEEYLSHHVRSAYQLDLGEPGAELLAAMKEGTIFTFKYSYRGGLEYDTAFLLCNPEGVPFLLVGTPGDFQFIGLAEETGLTDEEEEEEAGGDDDLDFSMM
jgi:hypothetical protein